MIQIKVNNIVRSDIRQDSVSWDQALSKDPAVLSFDIINKGQSLPALGDAILLEIGGVVKFRGTVTNKNNVIESGLLEKVSYEAKDGFHAFDRLLVIKAYTNQSASDIVSDIITNFTGGFTQVNVVAGAPTITTIRFNYEQPSQALKTIANAIGWDWYIDPDNDVHFFPPSYNSAPFSITDGNGKMISKSLEVSRDILSVKNTIYVRGGYYSLAISQANCLDKYVADGTQLTFPLVYRYKNVEVTVDGVAKTVGVDFITDPTTVDCLYNYQEKLIRFPDATKPAITNVVKVFGDGQIPLIVQAVDETSILAYGKFEYVLIDKSIESIAEAELQALAVMNDFSSASYEGYFETLEDGLKAGDYININSVSRGVSGSFKITSITARVYDSDSLIYKVKFLKSGKISFMDIMTDLLAEKRKNIVIADGEVIARLKYLVESLSASDELVSIVKSTAPYLWDDPETLWDFFTWA